MVKRNNTIRIYTKEITIDKTRTERLKYII